MSAVKPYCEKLRLLFEPYHDGDLSAFLAKVVERHLAACRPCRADYALLEKAVQAVKALPAPDVPPRVLRKVVESLSHPDGGAQEPEEIPGMGWASET